ncbi:capsule biosynthesis GfcC family protein [Candidatus Symbiopectobacterium sp. NZEC127]|uniref:capsule biosynthesis GfcC family protein n=1 Tax=Candidatus Symbiopectobacterium sp. NZEC127 TaxID=2820472 RepID=UPI0022280896|nr:capsule biosynthesis GfcC family protein [Candidatus Symbiopectobacterium sp. NZEC127]MCW2488655.1 capsule biosynthesis GfcC family protein [Candidatus Symbiopectobacterium sp. NZEC127]
MLAFSRMALLMLLTAGAAQAAQLTIKTPQQTLAVVKQADGTRLIEFYQQVAFPADVNWRSALISDYASTQKVYAQAEALRKSLAELETRWRNSGDGDLAISAWLMRKMLDQVDVAGRISTPLDPDRIRITPRANRPLVGDYALYIAPLASHFTLAGLINTDADIAELKTVGDVALQSGGTVRDYVLDRRFLTGANRDAGYLIDGQGAWRKVPLALWNQQHIEPAAGETLFIGFDPSVLPNEFVSLNDQIADFLANRIPH